jgi:PAS domain S-box-containing protein
MTSSALPGLSEKTKNKRTITFDAEDNATLHKQAFDNAAQAHIIFEIKTGKIILANKTACLLLGYSAKEILGKKRSAIFADTENIFKKMIARRKITGKAIGQVNAILKSGKLLPCEVSSAIFKDIHGTDTSITTITDLRSSIAAQKKIDSKKEKIVNKNTLKALEKSNLFIEQSNQWLKYFGETSYDVMWDWDIFTGKIYVGHSIEDVFGYKIQNDTIDFNIFDEYLLPTERNSVNSKIKKSLSSRKKFWEDSFSIRRNDGEMASTTSRACIIRDENGQAIRLVGATQDVSKVLALEKNLHDQDMLHKEDEEKFRLTTKLSFDVIWDWNMGNNDLFIGEGFKDLFGYTIRKNKGNMIKDWVNYIHPDDKDSITKELACTIRSKAMHWKHAYRIIRADSTIAKVYVRASIMRDTNGRAYRMIGAVQDLTRQKDLEEQLDIEVKRNNNLRPVYEENFKLIFNSSSDIFYDVDLHANSVVLSDAYENNLGYKVIDNTTSGDEWMSRIHPEDKENLLIDYQRVLNTQDVEWKYNFRYLKSDNSEVSILGNSIVLRRPDGVAYRIIGSMQDADKNKNIEGKLAMEIESRESAMMCATEEARTTERSEIGRELHDNVNQLLGASKLYLEMAKKGGKNSKMYLERSTEYTLTAIEEIRKLTKGLTTADTINISGFLGSVKHLVSDTMEVQPIAITLQLDEAIEESIGIKVKLNLFRIIQEQFNNIIKHANASTIMLSLQRKGNGIILSITDNGIGFDVSKTRRGIGLNNIIERVKIINATSQITSKIGNGTTFYLSLDTHTLCPD